MRKKLINYDDYAEDPAAELKKQLNVHPLQYQHFFRAALIGPTGAGKTNYLANILTGDDCLAYDRIWVLAKDASDPKYVWMKEHFNKLSMKVVETYRKKTGKRIPPPVLFRVFKNVSELPPLDDTLKQEEAATVMIIDDFINDRATDAWMKNNIHFMRHFHISLFYLAQSWFQIPKFSRLQFDYVSFWGFGDNRTIDELMKTFSLGDHKDPKDRKRFLDHYHEALKTPFMPFTLDLTYAAKKDPKLAYRAGLLPIHLKSDSSKTPEEETEENSD